VSVRLIYDLVLLLDDLQDVICINTDLAPNLQTGLPSHRMVKVLLVFIADKFQQVGVGCQLQGCGNHPWLSVRFRIVDGNLQIQMPEVPPPKTLGNV
jgi:hypothetical protein